MYDNSYISLFVNIYLEVWQVRKRTLDNQSMAWPFVKIFGRLLQKYVRNFRDLSYIYKPNGVEEAQ